MYGMAGGGALLLRERLEEDGQAGDVTAVTSEANPEAGHVTAVTSEGSGTGAGTSRQPSRATEDLDELGARIIDLAAHIHAAEYELLVMIADFDERQGWEDAHANCAEWLAFHTGHGLNACRERVRAARKLRGLPLTSAAMARGELSFSKVRELTRKATPDNESELLDYARHATSDELETFLRGWKLLDRHDEDQLARLQYENRYATVHPKQSGMYRLSAELPPDTGALLMRALERFGLAVHGTDTDVDARQRFADALVRMTEVAMEVGPEGAGSGGSGGSAERNTVHLHVEPATLTRDGEGERSHLHDNTRVTAVTSARLACDAAVVKVTEDGEGNVLDVGRRTRTVSPALRRALEGRDGGCRFPGCGRRHTDAHHVVHWADGGATALENLVLLCRHHHTLVHEGGFRVEPLARGRVRFFGRSGLPVPERPDAAALMGQIEGALMRRNRRRGVEPAAFAPMARSRRVPWAVEAAAEEALDP
jgi:hypothetical protein